MSRGEILNREVLGKSLVARRRIEPGEQITARMVADFTGRFGYPEGTLLAIGIAEVACTSSNRTPGRMAAIAASCAASTMS